MLVHFLLIPEIFNAWLVNHRWVRRMQGYFSHFPNSGRKNTGSLQQNLYTIRCQVKHASIMIVLRIGVFAFFHGENVKTLADYEESLKHPLKYWHNRIKFVECITFLWINWQLPIEISKTASHTGHTSIKFAEYIGVSAVLPSKGG
ncbi:MAG: hypothetical protein WCM76_15175 [Bacteroidota bacterium]